MGSKRIEYFMDIKRSCEIIGEEFLKIKIAMHDIEKNYCMADIIFASENRGKLNNTEEKFYEFRKKVVEEIIKIQK